MRSIMSIFDHIRHCRDHIVAPEIQAAMKQQVAKLLDKTCSIKNPTLTYVKSDNANEFTYLFEQGKAHVICFNTEIEVHVFFNPSHGLAIVPHDTLFLGISVDHSMRYQESFFHIMMDFEQAKKNEIFACICMLTVSSPSGYLVDSILFSKTNISKKFFAGNGIYSQSLIKFLHYFAKKPDDFITLFPNYPKYSDMDKKGQLFRKFLTQFNEEYVKNNEEIQSKLLVLDMQSI